MNRILFALLALICGASCALSCEWMDHKFRHLSGHSLQLLDEMAAGSLVNSEEDEEENHVAFPNGLYRQASSASIGSHGHKKKNKKLHMHFKGLSNRILKEMGHSAEAWELIREQIEFHLMRIDLLLKPLQTN
ncbi:uncharacterized protein V6R79_015601 [Siganus canaliculatus]